ncbi:hypothetical protein J699_00736 [Acinetobacter sp. 1000160]|nr:hypothetical protein J537_3774 [Acinetobacter baumannii 1437282]EXB46753.1 hypothetical protein J522_2320 [Acinetobacter baumannii 146457]EYT23587.1 hypothetical protein J699_00736 [Acinetobacter sp. 1000160]
MIVLIFLSKDIFQNSTDELKIQKTDQNNKNILFYLFIIFT